MPAGDSALLQKLNRFLSLGKEELAALAAIEARRHPATAGTELIHERQPDQRAYILQRGWAACYKLLPDGGRQVIDVRIPGDFMGFRSVLLRTSDHSSVAVTDVVVAEVDGAQMLETFQALPRLAVAMLWAASRDEAMVVEHLVGIGRRSALARTAHFLVELGLRLDLIGLRSRTGFACPLNQYVLSDLLGLTAIHVNRVLRQLRELGLLTFRNGEVTVHDLPGLQQLAEHDSGYLDQTGKSVELRAALQAVSAGRRMAGQAPAGKKEAYRQKYERPREASSRSLPEPLEGLGCGHPRLSLSLDQAAIDFT